MDPRAAAGRAAPPVGALMPAEYSTFAMQNAPPRRRPHPVQTWPHGHDHLYASGRGNHGSHHRTSQLGASRPGGPRRFRHRCLIAAGPALASNPRCAPRAQSRGLFRRPPRFAQGPLDLERRVRSCSHDIDRRQRSFRRARVRRSSDHRQRRPRALRVDYASAVFYRRSPPLIALLEKDALDPALTRRVDVIGQPIVTEDVARDLDDDVIGGGACVVVEPRQALQARGAGG